MGALLVALRQGPSPTDAAAWGAQAERLGVVGLLAVAFVLFILAMHRQWLVMGWIYRVEREEKIMWRTAYMELRGTTRQSLEIAKIATEKVTQP
jgi:hypothetical protein